MSWKRSSWWVSKANERAWISSDTRVNWALARLIVKPHYPIFFSCSVEHVLERRFFKKFFTFFESSSEIGETFPTFWLGNFCPIVKTEVYVFRGNIWGIQFFWKTFYLQRWILKEKIPISWWKMSAGLIRLHSTCPERLFADLSSFADHLRTLSEKFSEFWWWSFGTVAKTAFHLFRGTMKEWKNIFLNLVC